MIKSLVRQLGLDKLGEVLADEVRRIKVEVLEEERTLLAKLLARLDERIRGLGGKRRGRPTGLSRAVAKVSTPKPGRKVIVHKTGETLQLFVLRAFRKTSVPLKVKNLVRRVQQLGYQSAATPKNLLLQIYRVLADDKLFKRIGTGLYTLALPRRGAARRWLRRRAAAQASARSNRPRKASVKKTGRRAAAHLPPPGQTAEGAKPEPSEVKAE